MMVDLFRIDGHDPRLAWMVCSGRKTPLEASLASGRRMGIGQAPDSVTTVVRLPLHSLTTPTVRIHCRGSGPANGVGSDTWTVGRALA
jgi:hypothetical protein